MFLKKALLPLLFSASLFASPRDSQGAVEVIKYLFETKYAPLHFKEQTLGWNLNQSIYGLKQAISFSQNPQWLLRRFFLQPADYHLGVVFHSTSSSLLPFTIHKIGNEIYVSSVEKGLEELSVGDQILFWNGIPAIEAFNQFKMLEMVGHHEMHSSDSFAAYYFTQRMGDYGMNVPFGDVQLTILSKETLELQQAVVSWHCIKEYFPFNEIPELAKKSFSLEIEEPRPRSLLDKQGISLHFKAAQKTPKILERTFDIGSKRGYLPILGPVLHEFKKAPFFYYIYETPHGSKVAYLRLGSFEFERVDLVHLKKTLNFFEKNTDALILDIGHNPGGLVLNMFALISYFIDFPIDNYEQTEILTSEELELAVALKLRLENVENEKDALKIIKKESQYNPTLTLTNQLLNYADFLLDIWESGERITPLYPILGIDLIHPDASCHYSKPLLLLTDHLSLSCGDFFPGILQEIGRASVMGQTTGGAGGLVTQPLEFPNQLGIKLVVFTSSLVYKNDGDWIENKGITPDAPYEISTNDIKYSFCEYANAINEKIDEMIEDCAR